MCVTCGNTFQADLREHKRGNAHYCSLKCVAHRPNKKVKKIPTTCVYCNTSFLSGSLETKYCSRECKLRNYRKKQKPDIEFHANSLARVLKELPCEICGWNETTRDVHHIIPVSEGGKSAMSNLIVVCPNHHRMYHKHLISEEATEAALKLRLSLHPHLYKNDEEQDALAGN